MAPVECRRCALPWLSLAVIGLLLLLVPAGTASGTPRDPCPGLAPAFPTKRPLLISDNLIFIKVPKCGSSTMGGVVRHLARRHGIQCFDPPESFVSVAQLADWAKGPGLETNGNSQGRCACNHHDAHAADWHAQASRVLPRARKIAIVRDPQSQFVSAVHSFLPHFENTTEGRRNARGAHDRFYKLRFRGFLRPSKYMTDPADGRARTRNNIAPDPEDRAEIEAAARGVLCGGGYEFVLVMERFDESLVVLQHLWELSLADLLHVSAKVWARDDPKDQMVPIIRSLLDKVTAETAVDQALHALASQRLDALIAAIGSARFKASLKRLKQAQAMAKSECADYRAWNAAHGFGNEDPCLWRDNGCGFRCLEAVAAKQRVQ